MQSIPKLCRCGCGNSIVPQYHHKWRPSKYIWGHYLKGSRNNHYKGIDKWVKKHQGKYFCQCPDCLEKGQCNETVITIRPAHHYMGIPRFKYHHQLRGVKQSDKWCENRAKAIRQAYVNDPTYRERLREYNLQLIKSGEWGNKFKKRPTKPERVFATLMPSCIRYTGDGKWWRKLLNGKYKNPDFKVKGENKVIEIFGDYHHRNDNPAELISLYKQSGIDCLVIWEREVYNHPENVKRMVKNFL